MYITKDGERLYLKSWSYNAALILATWKSPGGHEETAVFEKLDQVENYFVGLFWEPVIIDRREQGRRSA